MICSPYKNCKISNVTQGFSDIHKAIDWSPPNPFGTQLVAPCNGRVCKIITDTDIYDEFYQSFRRGYGIIISEDNSDRYHLYWHCQQVFPVNMWQKVEQGKTVIAMMGNSGLVKYRNGEEVKDKDKLKPPYPGCHLHQEIFVLDNEGNRTYLNPLDEIDFSIPVQYNMLDVIQDYLTKIFGFLKRS